MRLLIDTHTYLWFVKNSKEITPLASSLIQDERNQILISIASLWEISIKTSRGRLVIDGGYETVADDLKTNLIEIWPISFLHTVKQSRLPFHHKDPFDRMIAAQALVEKINLVSVDDIFDRYFENSEVKRIW